MSFDNCSEFARMNSFFPSVLTAIFYIKENEIFDILLDPPTCSQLSPQDDQESPPPPPPRPRRARVWFPRERISSSHDSKGWWCSDWSECGQICSFWLFCSLQKLNNKLSPNSYSFKVLGEMATASPALVKFCLPSPVRLFPCMT